MRCYSEIVIAGERRNSISGEIANRKDDESLEVQGIPGGAQTNPAWKKQNQGMSNSKSYENIWVTGSSST